MRQTIPFASHLGFAKSSVKWLIGPGADLRAAPFRAQGQGSRARVDQQQGGRSRAQAQIIQRIEDASRYVPLDNLALSPQCGFASTFEGNLLTEDEQWRKMQLVVDVARQIWGPA